MLTEAEVRDLVAAGEQFEVEFKGEEREPLSDAALVETVVCLANGRGGVVLVGVEDDGRVTGARPRHGSYTDVRRLAALVGNQTVPSCPVTCGTVTLDGRDVLVVEVPPGRPITSTSGGVYRRRAIDARGRPQCLPLLYHEMLSREGDRGQRDPSAAVVPGVGWDDLDPLEFERLRQTIARNPGRADATLVGLSEVELVKALGLGEGGDRIERVRLAGLLLLGREEVLRRTIPTHEVAFQVLSGTRVAVNDFFRWPLIRVSQELGARFDARNEEREIAVGPVRVGIPDYSPTGFREAVHNALVHRDYARLGAVHVQWRDTEVEVSNPGGLVEGVRVDTILTATPRARNPVLADAFKRIGLVERTGRGVDTIFEGQLRYGRPAPDYSLSTGQGVQVILPGGPANLALARFIIERDSPARPVTLDDMLVVNAVERERRIDAPTASRLLQKSEASARAVLERLVEAGTLEARGERPHRIYRFSGATYAALGQRAAHVRALGFEPFQQEQMVLQYVRAHGRITRGEVADLCQVTDDQAKRLLRRLVRRGNLASHGATKGAWYGLAPKYSGAPET